MSEPFNPVILQPGDAILYFRHDFGSWLIALKTWTKVAHVEIYRGDQIGYSSRCETGVNAYLINYLINMNLKDEQDAAIMSRYLDANG